MFETVTKLLRGSDKGLTCAVITPIGPGHEGLYHECQASVDRAWHSSRGPFAGIHQIAIDDSAGKLGRSRARNDGIERAITLGAEWLFFLDADDLMAVEAFEEMRPHVANQDAVWGLIVGQSPSESEPHLRVPQILTLGSLDEMLLFDPFLTLQMGHFVRSSVAREVRFDESMNVGEDFDYYLRLWQNHRCVKVQKIFFINRHSRRSTGPRAATAEEWGACVRGRLLEERKRRHLLTPSARSMAIKNAHVAELQEFCRRRELANGDNYCELARQMPFRGYFDVTDYAGGNFVLYTNNDDPACASLGWTGEYRPLSTALWQSLAGSANTILDIGAGSGFFGFLAGRVAADAGIHCFEPLAANYARLCLNISLNGFKNVHAVNAAAGDSEAIVSVKCHSRVDSMISARNPASRSPSPAFLQPANCIRIDDYAERNQIDRIDLVKIEVDGSELAVIDGMQKTIARYRPDLLITDFGGESETRLSAPLRRQGYGFYAIHDARREIEAVTDVVAHGGALDLNWFISVREPSAIAQMASQVHGRPLNFG